MLSLTWCNIRFTLKRNVLKRCCIEKENSKKVVSWWLRIMIKDKKMKIVKRKEVNRINFRSFVVFYRRRYRRLRENSTCYFTTFVKCLVKRAFDRLFDQQNFWSFVSSKELDRFEILFLNVRVSRRAIENWRLIVISWIVLELT